MNHTAAFKCETCPRNNDPSLGPSCPNWWELLFTNTASGELKTEKACGYTLMPQMLIEVIKASNRPAEQISVMTNQLVEGLSKIERAHLRGEPITLQGPIPDIARLPAGGYSGLTPGF